MMGMVELGVAFQVGSAKGIVTWKAETCWRLGERASRAWSRGVDSGTSMPCPTASRNGCAASMA